MLHSVIIWQNFDLKKMIMEKISCESPVYEPEDDKSLSRDMFQKSMENRMFWITKIVMQKFENWCYCENYEYFKQESEILKP